MAELLGTASFPTGDLLLVDFGLLGYWCGDRPPVLAEGLLKGEALARANAAVDFEIVGADAAAVARRLDLADVKGRFAFDLPADGGSVVAKVREVCRESGLDASVRRVARVAHLERVRRLLDDDPGGVEVPYTGGWAVAVRGVPARELRVLGERMDDGEFEARWRSVWVECAEGEPVRSVECGYVVVDESRLMFADPLALNAWRENVSEDGLYDVEFWGGDAAAVFERLVEPKPSEMDDRSAYAWVDLAGGEAAERHRELGELQRSGLRFRAVVRPHDDDYRIRLQADHNLTESGTIEVGGAKVTGWFTSWGDGMYPLYRDLAADGTLLRVRVELGTPEIVARQRKAERWWFGDLAKKAIVTARVARDGVPAGRLIRDEPIDERDSGWQVVAGDESREYLDDLSNAVLMPLRELIELDPDLEPLFDAAAPAEFERRGGVFVPVPESS
ncbi:DUF2185 domain-containing protein [Actinokineospora auranticolor]|uniref:Immunity protein Imm33 domain-containing protein n=1 Tax=Actinokineospora auranticolor TaxID=155976 RepID=A0A2S6GC14_9PSEU|nr:DUF2185 domain-containing protein [Actinokineospora auranticolor]PPK61854.1 hypothetical protein CLV40_1382 [Actinokineospora auranticolor]